MIALRLRPANPERDFGQLAAWFSSFEDQQTTEASLRDYYDREIERITHQVAENEQGQLVGFFWVARHRHIPGRVHCDVFIRPDCRNQGIGSHLYENMEMTLAGMQARLLQVSIRDTCPECRAFAERRGFTERLHQIAMFLDLTTFDDRPYKEIITRLKSDGFHFTSMAALGNTEDAQRQLYRLNDSAAADTPGANAEHPWESFEDFQKSVCQADWYKPDGQMVVIDTSTGEFIAMSAITRMEGNPSAYNLFTGVDRRYRGRKLAQAVKVIALRYAREVLQAPSVQTNHNAQNDPMIAIDRKLGYIQTPGTYLMEKSLE